jgi:hypothetical protein
MEAPESFDQSGGDLRVPARREEPFLKNISMPV